MQTLSYGFKKPQTGDKGSVFFPALEQNFQQLNDHTHNGTDSSQIPASSIAVVTQSIVSGDWSSQGNGTYRQLVTTPVAIPAMDTQVISFRDTTTSELYHLKYEKVTANTFYVYINDNSKDLTVVYS